MDFSRSSDESGDLNGEYNVVATQFINLLNEQDAYVICSTYTPVI